MTGTWPLGWATGDITLASEFKKGVGALFDTTLVGASNVDFASISSAYAHLLIVVYARGDTVATNTAIAIRLNNDATANYDSQRLRGTAAAASAAETFAATSGTLGSIPAASAGANLFNSQIIFIPHYAGSTNNKLVLSLSSMKQGTTSGSLFNDLFASFWRSSAAINRITLLPAVGNFVAGTRVTFYGMGA